MCELRETDKRKADWRRDEVVDVRLCVAVVQPTQDVKAFGIELFSSGVAGQNLKMCCGGGDEIFNE